MEMRNAKRALTVLVLWCAGLVAAQPIAAQADDILTYRYDNARTGVTLKETILKKSNVKNATFGKLAFRNVDGNIYAQPLIVSQAKVAGRTDPTDVAAVLTTGKYPTFFRVVSKDSVQGPQDANYIINNLHPKALMIVDDQEAYSTGLVAAMTPIFKAAGIKVDHESVSQKLTDFSSLVAKVTPATTVVVLPWQVASNAQQLGRNLAQQHKKTVIFGTDGLFSPGTFTINGSYVSSFGPDITAIPADAAIAAAAKSKYGNFGTFGPPVFAAQHVIDEAIASVCKSGQTPSRANVLAAIKNTNEPASILGQPIKFTPSGDVVNGKFFLFKIDSTGKYNLIPG